MARKTRFSNPRRRHKSGGAAESSHQIRAGHPPRVPGASATSSKEQGSEDTYEVGYGRPPLSTRFKPGQSGNPKGRAKQSRNLRTIVKQVSNEQMQIREGRSSATHVGDGGSRRTTFTRAFKETRKHYRSLIVLVRQCGYGADHDEARRRMCCSVRNTRRSSRTSSSHRGDECCKRGDVNTADRACREANKAGGLMPEARILPPHSLTAAIFGTDLYSFIQASFPIVSGGNHFLPNWHVEAMCYRA